MFDDNVCKAAAYDEVIKYLKNAVEVEQFSIDPKLILEMLDRLKKEAEDIYKQYSSFGVNPCIKIKKDRPKKGFI